MPTASALVSVPLLDAPLDGDIPSSAAMPGVLAQTVPPPVTAMSGVAVTSHGQAHLPRLGLSLSPDTAPFPQKLVDRACSGQFIEMRDLLTDNVSLLQQLETFGGQYPVPAMPGMLKPRFREVTTLPSWLYCYIAYVAMRASDQGVRDMLAYARLIIREAQRHGGSGWLDYDRVFRQQAALDPSLKWNTLHPGIQASTLVGRTSRLATFCTLCREPDHTAEQCALSYMRPPGSQLPLLQPSTSLPAGPYRTLFRRRPESLAGICVNWNKGRCTFPACKFKHICATCHQQHTARDCIATPASSEYRSFTNYPVQGNSISSSRPKPLL